MHEAQLDVTSATVAALVADQLPQCAGLTGTTAGSEVAADPAFARDLAGVVGPADPAWSSR